MGFLSKPKAPKKTGEQEATEKRTRSLLDDEIEESEERFKALARGKLGRASLLSGAPKNVLEAAGGGFRGGSGGAGSLLSRGAGTGGNKGSTSGIVRAPNLSRN